MIRTHILPCALPSHVADALNQANGAIYTQVLVSHWRKRFHTTIWKQTAIKKHGAILTLSTGKNNRAITLTLPPHLEGVLRVLEVRLVYDKKARRYTWHVVIENGRQPKAAPGANIVSVDLGEVHPAVIGDPEEATLITCRERRHEKQGTTNVCHLSLKPSAAPQRAPDGTHGWSVPSRG